MRLACFVIDDSANSKFCSACDKLLLVFQILGNISVDTMLFFMSSNFSEGLLACQSWLNFVLRRCSSYFLEPKQLYFGSKALLGFRKFLAHFHHFSSVVRRPSSTFHILIFSSETTRPIATKLWWNGPWIAPFKIVSGDPDFQPRWPPS